MIGREAGVDVPLDDAKVSRRHATVAVGEGAVVLADAGSTNGTWLNGQRVGEPRELRDGDRVRIGQVELRFFDPASAATVPVMVRYAPVAAPGAVGAVAAPTQASPAVAGPIRLAAVGGLTEAAPMASVRPGRMLRILGLGLAVVAVVAWGYLQLG